MAWFKSASTYVADWRSFSVKGSSLRQLAVFAIVLGFLWGIAVVAIHGLPGSEAREMRSKWGKPGTGLHLLQ
jgi:purine-cytosine permease-like protein